MLFPVCVFASPGAENSWSEEGVGLLIISPKCFCIAQQAEYIVQRLFVSSDQNVSSVLVISDWCVSDELMLLAASHTILQNSLQVKEVGNCSLVSE